jgi:chemotaxis methyl-accepting protein methylase
MQQLGCRTVEEYLIALDRDRNTRHHCERLLSVSISRFFRDRALWKILENDILPGIVKGDAEPVKVWSAGCACGEEVYSFKILWHTMAGRFECLPDVEIWATDMNPVYLDKAQAGIFSRSSLKEVPGAIRAQYFRPGRKERSYTVEDSLREGIIWRVHNLLTHPPGTDFRLVFLRNSILTYCKEELKVPAFKKVVDSLASGGYLIIGTHEKIPSGVPGLVALSQHSCILRKQR